MVAMGFLPTRTTQSAFAPPEFGLDAHARSVVAVKAAMLVLVMPTVVRGTRAFARLVSTRDAHAIEVTLKDG